MAAQKIALILMVLSLTGVAQAVESNRAKEARWESQIVDALFVGEPLKLKAGEHEFLALHAESVSGESKGGVILIHGIGVHPAWPDVIQPLRINLPEFGWHTLSLQMPILANDVGSEEYPPLFDDASKRIQAGIAYYKEKGVSPIVIVAHSLGSTMASHFLANNPKSDVSAFVGIGMAYNDAHPKLDNADSLSRIDMPVLELYGSLDLDAVRQRAGERAAAAKKAGNEQYRQRRIEGADHFFRNMEDTLIRQVRGWLEKVTASQ